MVRIGVGVRVRAVVKFTVVVVIITVGDHRGEYLEGSGQ